MPQQKVLAENLLGLIVPKISFYTKTFLGAFCH
jgi:hypothetical protein